MFTFILFLHILSSLCANSKIVLNEKSDRKPRILTPSRVIVPPEIPHYIYFQPMFPPSTPTPPTKEENPNASTLSGTRNSPPHSCLVEEDTVCSYEEQSYPHQVVRTVVQTYQAELDRLADIVQPQPLQVRIFLAQTLTVLYPRLHCLQDRLKDTTCVELSLAWSSLGGWWTPGPRSGWWWCRQRLYSR